ncbi:MAG: dockerin type I repeat-containing protein [Prevotella sp.]|nr:dockerin type I repeat-containing protein [Prevotella sp.]
MFANTPTSTLYVPVGSRSAYSSTSGWSEFDNIVEVKPDHVVSTTDVILVKDGQTWLAVSLENKKDILGFQFDLTLPSGIVVNTDADGNLVSKLGDRCSDFTQTFTYIGDNKYRVTCLSMEGAAVTGHDGELMRISLTSDREVEPGDYDIVLSNIQLTTTEGTATVTIYPEDYNSKLTLLNYALGDVDGNGSITVTDAVMVVQHILYKTPSNFILETADVNTDGIVNVGDVVSILDLINTSNSKAASVKALEAE